MTSRSDRIRSSSISYQSLVEEAAISIRDHGMVDMETASVADELGFNINTLTDDASALLGSGEAFPD